MSFSNFTQAALCLLLVITVVFGAASASADDSIQMKGLPGSCLTAASTLCANADTNAMRCLTKLATAGDARVPSICSEALMAGVTVNPRRKHSSRAKRMSRLLTEGSACAGGNTCGTSFAYSPIYCNDANNGGCSGCSQGDKTLTSNTAAVWITVVSLDSTNPNGIACTNICCKAQNGQNIACVSQLHSDARTAIYCQV